MSDNSFVGIAGNIGVGKTTFTEIVAKYFGWREFYESVADNPYLDDFYQDMHRWSFNLQIYFLHHRFAGQIQIESLDSGVIAQDVQKVLPQLVRENHGGYLGVKHDRLVGLLIESIKEQQEQINELKQEMKELKNGST